MRLLAASGWWRDEAPSRRAYWVAALLGITVYVVAYGPAHAFAASDYWQLPQQDERMALMGYRYFLLERWHWPVFVSDAVNVPYVKSVAFLDCIPLWALINKSVATIVPPWTQVSAHAYLATWHLLAYALQPVFAVAIMRTLGHRRWLDAIVAALFFVAVPTWIFRYAHPALSAHWIELWALLLYLRTAPGQPPSRRLRAGWLAHLVVAALVAPYHVVICAPVFIAAMVRTGRRSGVLSIPLGLGCALLALWFAGYFAPESHRPQWGFDHESANALGWLIPARSGIVGDASRLIDVDATGYQYEGYAYLGLGFLGLLAVLAVRRELEARAAIRAHALLFLALVGFCVVSLSNRVFVGSHEVLTYSIPAFLKWIPDQYRSPGRFVWMPVYVLCSFLLHQAFTHWGSGGRRGAWLLLGLAALQVIDATGDWSVQRVFTARPQYTLDAPAQWRQLVHAHDRVVILPPYSCVTGDDGLRNDYASMELQWLASERALPINGTYATRARRRCSAEAREWATMELRPRTLYVVLPQATAAAERFEALGATCAAFAFGRVCSTERAPLAAATASGVLGPAPAPLTVTYGEPLALAAGPLQAAWSSAEDGGRWSTDAVAGMLLRVQGTAPATVRLEIEARAQLCSERPAQDVDVRLNGDLLATLHFDASSNDPHAVRSVTIPDRAALERGPIALQFVPHDMRSTATLRCGSETRRLGVWISRLSFR